MSLRIRVAKTLSAVADELEYLTAKLERLASKVGYKASEGVASAAKAAYAKVNATYNQEVAIARDAITRAHIQLDAADDNLIVAREKVNKALADRPWLIETF